MVKTTVRERKVFEISLGEEFDYEWIGFGDTEDEALKFLSRQIEREKKLAEKRLDKVLQIEEEYNEYLTSLLPFVDVN